jgi:hypothetical protein
MLLSFFLPLLALGVGAHANHSVSTVYCAAKRAVRSHALFLFIPRSQLTTHNLFVRFVHQAITPSRKLAIGTFASVGQELLGIPSANEEDVLFGATVVFSSLDGSRLAVGAPMHDYSTAEANELTVNDNGGAIFLYEYDGLV